MYVVMLLCVVLHCIIIIVCCNDAWIYVVYVYYCMLLYDMLEFDLFVQSIISQFRSKFYFEVKGVSLT